MSSFQLPSNHLEVPSQEDEADLKSGNQHKLISTHEDKSNPLIDTAKSKRPAERTFVQYDKEKCRRIANDLFAKTEKFLCPTGSKEETNSQFTNSSLSTLSSARVSEPLSVDSSSTSNINVVQSEFNKILMTMKDFESKFQYFKDRVESTAASLADSHSQNLSSATPDKTSTTTATAAEETSNNDKTKEIKGNDQIENHNNVAKNISLSSNVNVSVAAAIEYPVPLLFTFTAPSILSSHATQEQSNNGKTQ